MAKNRMQQEFDKRDQRLEVRLNKYLSEAGVCSRREADRLIEAGRVQVNGQTASMGCKIRPKDKILVDRKSVV